VGPFGLSDGTLDNYVIYFSVVISALPLGIEVGVGISDNCENCKMGGKGDSLLWRLFDLWWRWGWWIGFGLDLGVGVIWHWVGDLQYC
jgi:hypothetical protein